MDFYDVLERVLALLQRHKRVSYRALQRQFDLDAAYLEDLKAEIIEVQQLAVDEGGRILVWTGSLRCCFVTSWTRLPSPGSSTRKTIARSYAPIKPPAPT